MIIFRGIPQLNIYRETASLADSKGLITPSTKGAFAVSDCGMQGAGWPLCVFYKKVVKTNKKMDQQEVKKDMWGKPYKPVTSKQVALILLMGLGIIIFFVNVVGKGGQGVSNQVHQDTNISALTLPAYEKLPYGVAQNTILVSPSITTEELKLLLTELPKRLCPNSRQCLINVFDNADAARTDVDFKDELNISDEFIDFAQQHFIAQYSGWNNVKRYKINGQWVNF